MSIPSLAARTESVWFYTDAHSQPVGPVSFAELQRLVDTGIIGPNALLIEEGGSEWKSFASVLSQGSDEPPPLPNVANTTPLIQASGPLSTITLYANHVHLTRTGLSALGRKGPQETDIPFSEMRSIGWKAPSQFTNGFIQFVVSEGTQPTRSVFTAGRDKCAVVFRKPDLATFLLLRQEVERRSGLTATEAVLGVDSNEPKNHSTTKGSGRWVTFLALFFLYPLGLFFLWRSTAFSKRGKLIAATAFGAFFFFAVTRDSPPPSYHTPTASDAASSASREVKSAMRSVFGDNLKGVNVTQNGGGGYDVDVEFKEEIAFRSFAKHHVEGHMAEAFQRLYAIRDLPINSATMSAYVEFEDKFGGESEGVAYKTSLDAETAKQVHWDKRDTLDFTRIWETQYMHPGFRK